MPDPQLVDPNGPSDESLMEQIVKAQPNTPANVENASNPNSMLNKAANSGGAISRVHGDATRHPLSKQFTRQPRQ